MKKFKRSKAIGFFDEDFKLAKLAKLKAPLVWLSAGIDFNLFRDYLEKNLEPTSKNSLSKTLIFFCKQLIFNTLFKIDCLKYRVFRDALEQNEVFKL